MTTMLIVAGIILLLLVVAVRVIEIVLPEKKSPSAYTLRDSIMTPAERECFTALDSELGANYYFFPQIHLDSIVHPTRSDRQFSAFRHINQKSVDFVACDRQTLRPEFVVEVDDKTHSRPKRIERDKEVERILAGAGIPLVRIENRGRFDPKTLAQMVHNRLEQFSSTALK